MMLSCLLVYTSLVSEINKRSTVQAVDLVSRAWFTRKRSPSLGSRANVRRRFLTLRNARLRNVTDGGDLLY